MAVSDFKQQYFAAALLDPDHPVPSGIEAGLAARFSVYRNNVVVSLIEAIRTRFSTIEKIVGAEFFEAIVRLYVTAHPPNSPLMMCYGATFPEFLQSFPALAELPYLSDVARLEAARTRAYHAADANSLNPADLSTLAPSALLQARVILHPSLQILRSPHPVVTIWAMNNDEMELGPIDESTAEDAAIYRQGLGVYVEKLFPGSAVFLKAVNESKSLLKGAEQAFCEQKNFNLTEALAMLFKANLIVDLS